MAIAAACLALTVAMGVAIAPAAVRGPAAETAAKDRPLKPIRVQQPRDDTPTAEQRRQRPRRNWRPRRRDRDRPQGEQPPGSEQPSGESQGGQNGGQPPSRPNPPGRPRDADEPQGGSPTPTKPPSNQPAPSQPTAQPRSTPVPTPRATPRSVLRPFGTNSNPRATTGPARIGREHARSNAGADKPDARSTGRAAKPIARAARSWAALAAAGDPGAASQRSADPARNQPEGATQAKPEPCPANSCDPVTRLVAVVPGAVKLAIGGLGALALMFLVATVVSRRKLADARSRAVTDALTGLPDHSSIHDHLGALVSAAQREDDKLAVVLIDLDNFKRINDTYGHLKGDEVLRAVSDKAREELRGNDFVGRYGGEEFLAILPDTGRDGAVTVVDRLRRTFWDVEIDGVRELVTASMGVSAYPLDGTSANALIEAADDALYAAKAAGRNQVRTATPLPVADVRALPETAMQRPASVAV